VGEFFRLDASPESLPPYATISKLRTGDNRMSEVGRIRRDAEPISTGIGMVTAGKK
jgi:hypothetical protein